METQEIDIEQVSTNLAADILGTEPEQNDDALDSSIDDAVENEATETTRDPDGKFTKADDTDTLPVPQSWKKEMHEHWGKMPKAAQEYYLQREQQMLQGLEGYKSDAEYARSLKPVVSKYADILQQQGLRPEQAIDFLFQAHRQLSDTKASPEARMAYLKRVAESYGLTLPQAAQAVQDASGQAPIPAEVKLAMEKVERIEAALAQEQQQRYESARQSAAKEVEAFANDPKNIYFGELAESDIPQFIKMGLSLPEAYERAIYANPVTRQKEISRIQQESEKAVREKQQGAAKAAKKATSTNVKGRDTTRTPTEGRATLANLDEVLSETMSEIKSRND